MKTFISDFLESSKAGYPRGLGRTAGSLACKVWGVVVVVDIYPEYIHLVRLRCPKELAGRGYGGKALRWLCRLADKHGLGIYLHALSNCHKTLTDKQLKAWYKRHGFTQAREWLLRRPRAV